MLDTYIFDLSKEYRLLAHDEIISCLTSDHINFHIKTANEDVLIIKSKCSTDYINHLAHRLSMSFSIGRLLFSSSPSTTELKKHAIKHPININGSLAVRYKNRTNIIESKPIVQSIADIYTQSRPVNLNDPDNIIFLLITKETVYVSEQMNCIDRGSYEQRKAHLRPFFSPISLHPRLARALVNIAQVKPGDLLLDPFCGTGGFLIEAGLMDVKVIGNDISEEMIIGAKLNLKSYNIKPFNMVATDITSLPSHLEITVDAVVTDLPYGKATSTQGENIDRLYQRAIDSITKVLKPGKRAVIGSFSEELKEGKYHQLNHCISYPLRVHRSLTRWFHVFEKEP